MNISLLASWTKRYNVDRHKLWRQYIDFKYDTDRPNIFCSSTNGASQFFKGVMWAATAAKLGFRWKIGDGKKVKFWEDNWLGPSSLAIQFWEVYVLVQEKSGTVADLWDGSVLKCTFRRGFDQRLMNLWLEIVQLASTISFTEDEDALGWQFNSNGIYSSQSLYRIINFRGILPVFVPAVWHLKVPPRVQFFLWLLSKNKNLTRDNLNIRKKLDDLTCLFCTENESVQHLFFECVVAK